ncbi:hypothetical protein FXO38_24717 [Capsicum annuum]|nr:hypothetical protein FXO37_27073 [Capsicum annuum]KAF3635247.1 hypothetical protein FXO38_24717 [Capsicum annuum]
MNDATRGADNIRNDISALAQRYIVIDRDEECGIMVCRRKILNVGGDYRMTTGYMAVGPMAPFYVFPCGHAFHAQCLIAHVTRCTNQAQDGVGKDNTSYSFNVEISVLLWFSGGDRYPSDIVEVCSSRHGWLLFKDCRYLTCFRVGVGSRVSGRELGLGFCSGVRCWVWMLIESVQVSGLGFGTDVGVSVGCEVPGDKALEPSQMGKNLCARIWFEIPKEVSINSAGMTFVLQLWTEIPPRLHIEEDKGPNPLVQHVSVLYPKDPTHQRRLSDGEIQTCKWRP